MARFEKSAGAVIFYRKAGEIKFFLVKSSYWGFVKGLVEKDEKPEQTMRREIQEEAGLKNIAIIKGFKQTQKWFYRFEGEFIRKEAIFLLVEVLEQEAKKTKISFEHADFKWVGLDEALKLMRIKQNKEMLKQAYNFIKKDKQKRLF